MEVEIPQHALDLAPARGIVTDSPAFLAMENERAKKIAQIFNYRIANYLIILLISSIASIGFSARKRSSSSIKISGSSYFMHR